MRQPLTPETISAQPLIRVERLSKIYRRTNGTSLQALNNVSFTLGKGEVLGIAGESGCGKSTLGRTLLRLTEPSAGKIFYKESDITALGRQAMKTLRRDLQIVFQDPFGALNPRHTVSSLISEPLLVHKIIRSDERADHVAGLLEMVGLPVEAADRYPHEFSGGQRQRIAIARALASSPKFVVADEAVSALDVSVQSQIINLLVSLQKQLSLSMLFISHDLSVLRHLCNRIAIMYLGTIVETGSAEQILRSPQHPYTQALVSAIAHPVNIDQQRIVLRGELPDPANPPTGCVFHTRCQSMNDDLKPRCMQDIPQLVALESGAHQGSGGREVACHLYR